MRVLLAVVLIAGCGLGSSPRWQPDGGPGVCGDGVLDGSEACDDGNTVGDQQRVHAHRRRRSGLGIGGGGTVCSTPTQSAGNSSCCGGDNGDVELAAFGWIMVR